MIFPSLNIRTDGCNCIANYPFTPELKHQINRINFHSFFPAFKNSNDIPFNWLNMQPRGHENNVRDCYEIMDSHTLNVLSGLWK